MSTNGRRQSLTFKTVKQNFLRDIWLVRSSLYLSQGEANIKGIFTQESLICNTKDNKPRQLAIYLSNYRILGTKYSLLLLQSGNSGTKKDWCWCRKIHILDLYTPSILTVIQLIQQSSEQANDTHIFPRTLQDYITCMVSQKSMIFQPATVC